MFKDIPTIVIRGAGDLASGVALRLYRAGLRHILFLETAHPLAVRRTVSFSEAVYMGSAQVEGVQATCISRIEQVQEQWQAGQIPLLVDAQALCLQDFKAHVLIDAILAKKNLGTHKGMADFVIGLGPGFMAGSGADAQVHAVVETMRGHYLSRVITQGSAMANTGAPAPVMGYSVERVFWAEAEGFFTTSRSIGDVVEAGEEIGRLNDTPLCARFRGVIRGLLRHGTPVKARTKLADVDPRVAIDYCDEVSDKGLAIGGGVLEALLGHFLIKD